MRIIVLLILLVIFIGITVLQIFLSTRDNKGLGLILPAVTFICSLLLLLVIPSGSGADVLIDIIGFMAPMNIPTIILLVIYAICRLVKGGKKDAKENDSESSQIDEMNIQDLG